jgi:hypothetical protein
VLAEIFEVEGILYIAFPAVCNVHPITSLLSLRTERGVPLGLIVRLMDMANGPTPSQALP